MELSRYLYTLCFIGLTACAGTDHTESTGQYLDNSAITTKVKATLWDELGADSFSIKVISYKGAVQLSGFVDTLWVKRKAEAVAYSIADVDRVTNDLIVKQ